MDAGGGSLAWLCPPSGTASPSVPWWWDAEGTELSRGFSREGGDQVVHAEEAALGKVTPGEPRLAGATIYSTLEPCSQRKSRARTCTELIIAAGLRRVVIAWREPALVRRRLPGRRAARRGGLEVTELPEFAAEAAAPNRHLTRYIRSWH